MDPLLTFASIFLFSVSVGGLVGNIAAAVYKTQIPPSFVQSVAGIIVAAIVIVRAFGG